MEGGSQAQDHGQAIYAKIRYSVSGTFATGCSLPPNRVGIKKKSRCNTTAKKTRIYHQSCSMLDQKRSRSVRINKYYKLLSKRQLQGQIKHSPGQYRSASGLLLRKSRIVFGFLTLLFRIFSQPTCISAINTAKGEKRFYGIFIY